MDSNELVGRVRSPWSACRWSTTQARFSVRMTRKHDTSDIHLDWMTRLLVTVVYQMASHFNLQGQKIRVDVIARY